MSIIRIILVEAGRGGRPANELDWTRILSKECALCENEMLNTLIIDLGTKYQGNPVQVCKLCYWYSFFRGTDTLCPRTRQPLVKKVIETLPQNKQGKTKFAPTRGIAKGCKACKWPKDGRGCKHCVYPYNAHGRMQVNPEWAPYLCQMM